MQLRMLHILRDSWSDHAELAHACFECQTWEMGDRGSSGKLNLLRDGDGDGDGDGTGGTPGWRAGDDISLRESVKVAGERAPLCGRRDRTRCGMWTWTLHLHRARAPTKGNSQPCDHVLTQKKRQAVGGWQAMETMGTISLGHIGPEICCILPR